MNDVVVQIRAFQECPTSVGRRSRREFSSRLTTGVLSYKTRSIALMALLTLASIFIAAAPARAESNPFCLAGGEDNAFAMRICDPRTMPRYGIRWLRLLRCESSVHLQCIRPL